MAIFAICAVLLSENKYDDGDDDYGNLSCFCQRTAFCSEWTIGQQVMGQMGQRM